MTNEEKAKEIAERNAYYYEYEGSSESECEQSAFEMAEWKDEQFKDYFYSVLSIKMLYFLNNKEKRENTTIDKMDWHKTMNEFAHYLKQ